MEDSIRARVRRPLWQEKLDTFIQNKLANPASPHRKLWVERTQEYNDTHTRSIIEILKNEFGDLRGLRLVDMGCGSGLDAINLAREGAVVTGVEACPELIEIAELRAASENLDVKFLSLDRFESWQRKESFDAAIGVDVLEHVEAPEKLFAVCSEILRPGGILILTTPNRWAIRNIISDPHWRLFGVTLLPRRLAEPYVVKVRRVLREYDMTDFIGLRSMRAMLRKNDFVAVTDSAMDGEQKLLSPAKVANSGKRKMANLVSRVSRIRPLRRLFIWAYCNAFVRTWQVVAKKPEKRFV